MSGGAAGSSSSFVSQKTDAHGRILMSPHPLSLQPPLMTIGGVSWLLLVLLLVLVLLPGRATSAIVLIKTPGND
jgi:hypothetical protein